MDKTIIFVHTPDQVLGGFDAIKHYIQSNAYVLVVSYNANTHYALKDNCIPHMIAEDYFEPSTFHDLDVDARNLANSWYQQNCFGDLISYNGISLPLVTEYSNFNFFSHVLECIKLAETIIKVENPTEIVLLSDNPEDTGHEYQRFYNGVPNKTTILVAESKNVNIRIIDIALKNFSTKDTNTIPMESMLKVAANVIIGFFSLIHRRSKNNKINILCSHEYHITKNVFQILNDAHVTYYGLSRKLIKQIGFSKIIKGEVSFFPVYTNNQNKHSVEYAKKVKTVWQIVEKQPPVIRYQDYDLWSVIEKRFFYEFHTYFPNVINKIEFTTMCIRKKKINVIITSSMDVEHQRILILVANKVGILSVVLHHGVLNGNIGISPSLPLTKIAAWGMDDRNFLIDLGFDNDKITLTGPPHFDDYIENNELSKQVLCDKLNLDPTKKIVVVTTHHCERWVSIANLLMMGMEWHHFFKMVIDSVNSIPNCQLVVKLHPTDEESKIHERMIRESSHQDIPIFQEGKYLYDLLNVCDIFINFPSTTGLEAMLLNKPVITIIPSGKKAQNKSMFEEGLVVKSKQELDNALKKLVQNEDVLDDLKTIQNKYIDDHIHLQDGKASERVAGLIRQMMDEVSK